MVIFGLLSMSFLLFPQEEVNAQDCFTKPIVASNCAGTTCGNPTELTYIVGHCTGPVRLCVTHESSTLCIGQTAIGTVSANGVVIATGDITASGSSIPFLARCGAHIQVKVQVVATGPIFACLIGAPPPDITYALRR